VVNCICNGLAQMDIGGSLFKKNNIIVWDRTDVEIPGRGYTIYDGSDPNTVRCFGTNHSGVGYNTSTPLNVNGVTSNPSRIISGMCNYLINASVLKTAGTAFVSLGMKNHFGSVDNPGSLHGGQLNPYLPALGQQIRDVIVPNNIQRLCIIDGLFGLYSGGPSGSPNFNPKLILMSKDPVACDKQGENVINAERALHSLEPMSSAYITTAAQPPYSLGTTEINLIELNNIGIQEPARPAPGDDLFDVTPDPVRDRATVTFAISRQGAVSLELVNAAGRTEARLFAGTLNKGRHHVDWRAGRRLPAGTYFLRLNNAGATRVREVMVVH
jgi:hypothetical protein